VRDLKSASLLRRPLTRTSPALPVVLLTLLLTACVGEKQRAGSGLALGDCRRPDLGGGARCGTLSVPEDPADPHGRTIPLNIVVLPASDEVRRSDAILYLVGGPGLGATESATTFFRELSSLREVRDVVLVDQRGTGKSNPLHCSMPPEELLGAILAGRYEPSTIEACLDGLDADPTFYTSTETVQDLDEVRSTLGYDQFNLVGVSYGSRLALGYLQRYPTRVRTVALRGVSSPAGNLLSVIGAASEQVLSRLFAHCSGDPECSSSFPKLERAFREVLSRLEEEPLELEVERPNGESVKLTITRDLFAGVVRYALYSDLSTRLVPQLIVDAVEGRRDLLAKALAEYLGPGLASSLSLGSYLSIVCAEDMPFFERPPETAGDEPFFFTSSIVDNHEAVCGRWPHRDAPADFKSPVRSAAPVLLMSGSEDPATSAEAANEISELLEDSRHLVTPGLGHFPMWTDCFVRNVALLVDSGVTGALDESCAEDYETAALAYPG
jgi:pimeloyl-ACP methyl ester carboxylesterase